MAGLSPVKLVLCDRVVLGMLSWFAVVLAAPGRLVCSCAVACMGLAGCIALFVSHMACLASSVICCGSPVLGLLGFAVVALLRVLCLACFGSLPSSSPPNGRLVLVWGVLGRSSLFVGVSVD